MGTDADVIVVGAGPTGSSLARIDWLLVETAVSSQEVDVELGCEVRRVDPRREWYQLSGEDS